MGCGGFFGGWLVGFVRFVCLFFSFCIDNQNWNHKGEKQEHLPSSHPVPAFELPLRECYSAVYRD